MPIGENLKVVSEITPEPWDGRTGGVIAVESSGTMELQANIDASAAGFRGGEMIPINCFDNSCEPTFDCGWDGNYYNLNTTQISAGKGEGIFDLHQGHTAGRGKAANAGGGGNHNEGGGGGGGGFAAGGIGGECNSGTFCLCDKSVVSGRPGLGMDGFGYSAGDNRIFMGGGGGAGNNRRYNTQNGSPGKRGGGIVFLRSDSINGHDFAIMADGEDGYTGTSSNGMGGGGGGGGGAIVMDIQQIDSLNLNATGGRGSDNFKSGFTSRGGPGGGGGGGVIWIPNNLGNGCLFDISGGQNGIVSHAGGSTHGSEAGLDGALRNGLTVPSGPLEVPLRGVYSVDPNGGDFPDLTAAGQALTERGIESNVRFEVATGSYTDTVVVGPVNFACEANDQSIVEFVSATEQAADVTVSSTQNGGGATFTLNGEVNLLLRQMTIDADGNTHIAILTDAAADALTLDSVDVRGSLQNNGRVVLESPLFVGGDLANFGNFEHNGLTVTLDGDQPQAIRGEFNTLQNYFDDLNLYNSVAIGQGISLETDLRILGDLDNTGLVDPLNAQVIFDGNTLQSVTGDWGNGNAHFHSIRIENTDGVDFPANTWFSGDLTNFGSFTPNTAAFTAMGSSPQQLLGLWTATNGYFTQFTLANTAGLTITDTLFVQDALELDAGQILTGNGKVVLQNPSPGALDFPTWPNVNAFVNGTLERAIDQAAVYSLPVGATGKGYQLANVNITSLGAATRLRGRFVPSAVNSPLPAAIDTTTECGFEGYDQYVDNGYWDIETDAPVGGYNLELRPNANSYDTLFSNQIYTTADTTALASVVRKLAADYALIGACDNSSDLNADNPANIGVRRSGFNGEFGEFALVVSLSPVPQDTDTLISSRVNHAKDGLRLTAYPNPVVTGSALTLEMASPTEIAYELELVDLTGQAVFTQTLRAPMGNSRQQIQLPGISAGVYLLKLKSEHAEHSLKLIITR